MRWANFFAGRSRTSSPTDERDGPVIPLSCWADRELKVLARATGSARIAELDGQTLLGERGSANDFTMHHMASAGLAGSRLYRTADDRWFALTIIREVDRELLPALFMDDAFDAGGGFDAIAKAVSHTRADGLLSRGRDLGMCVALADEVPRSLPVEIMSTGKTRAREPDRAPVVIDLSAIWAGPLTGHLLWLAGAEVTKVESRTRPDLIRRDDPATFDQINQGKANVVLDFDSEAEKRVLIERIRKADIVIESSRPRALRHLGIDADELVRDTPGLVWLSITGHGATGRQANWAGIGNDCGVAAGLSMALERASGRIGYVGDALPDPLTGITAAIAGWRAFQSGKAQRIGFSMAAIAARALAEERARDADRLYTELRAWGDAMGGRFPKVRQRPMLAPVHAFGEDTEAWLTPLSQC